MNILGNLGDSIRDTGRGLRQWLLLSFLLIVTNCALKAQQRTQDIMPLLEGYEWELKPEQFICRGEDTDEVLRAIASDSTLPNYYRLRALTALSLFQNPETADFLVHMTSTGSHPSLTRAALSAFSQGFIEQQPERVISLARRLLSSSDEPQLQYAAAKTLAVIPHADAQTVLDNYINADISPLQRQQLTQYRQEAKERQSKKSDGDVTSKVQCPAN